MSAHSLNSSRTATWLMITNTTYPDFNNAPDGSPRENLDGNSDLGLASCDSRFVIREARGCEEGKRMSLWIRKVELSARG